MNAWLTPLREALDARTSPVAVFFRDDDGGWDDDALLALVRVHARRAVPIDLAVIPACATPTLVARLAPFDAGLVGVHQHGWRHTNHEPEGRKCEFGPSRGATAQHSDLEQGRSRLASLFGSRVDPIFTPPWNRCTHVTLDALAAAGFRALSRDATAKSLAPPPGAGGTPVAELPVTIDWMKHRAHGPDLATLGSRIADGDRALRGRSGDARAQCREVRAMRDQLPAPAPARAQRASDAVRACAAATPA